MFLTEGDYKKAKENGISRELADDRFYNEGLSRDKAVGLTNQGATTKQEMIKIERGRMAKIAVKNGVNYNTFMSRVKRGWNLEDAATRKPQNQTVDQKEREYIKKAEEKASTTPLLRQGRKGVKQ